MSEQKIRAVIVDDTGYYIDLLQAILTEHFPEVKILETFTDPVKASKQLKGLDPDLLFLDVQMPGLNGFELLEKIQPFDFEVIFTTSYDKFALQAIQMHALHYLIKPVDLDELQKALERFKKSKNKNQVSSQTMQSISALKLTVNKFAVPTVDGMSFINLNDVIRLEADGNYSNIHLASNEKIVSSKNLGYFDELLMERGFFRLHASHLINLNHIAKYVRGDSAYVLMTDKSHITIARRKKDEFMKLFE